MSEVELRDFDPARDAAGANALWDRSFGAPRGGQTLEWLFREGPAGPSPRSVAVVGDRVVAHAGAAALRFRIDGRAGLGGYSVGAMTDPAFRGRGLFVKTALHLYERMARDGMAFVAGFSNAESARLHTGTLGRAPIRPFPWSARPLRPFAVLATVLGRAAQEEDAPLPPLASPRDARGVEVAACAADDARIDAVWTRAAPTVRVGAVRDAAYARWRYASRPDAGYRAALALRGDEPVGWVVVRMLPIRGLRAVFVLDALADPADAGAARALLAAVEACGHAARAHLVSVLRPGSGAVQAQLLRRGYLPIPERLHPQTIRLSVKGLGGFEACDALAAPAAWHLSWGDTDVV